MRYQTKIITNSQSINIKKESISRINQHRRQSSLSTFLF
uniref:Uncharacterized protein n=1 Tax=Nelumbo nucifera TaxID=4432 RepID=A0A822ZYQ5_NELNU|nr:TPA_asm: hypothetical protein HUJ06_017015 [Nelumbo nucifera]